MRVERLNHAIFWVSSICFALQGVGYLSPAWFVNEMPLRALKGSFSADGRRFQLPMMADPSDAESDKNDGTGGQKLTTAYTMRPRTTSPNTGMKTTTKRIWIGTMGTQRTTRRFTVRPWKTLAGAGNWTTPSHSRRPRTTPAKTNWTTWQFTGRPRTKPPAGGFPRTRPPRTTPVTVLPPNTRPPKPLPPSQPGRPRDKRDSYLSEDSTSEQAGMTNAQGDEAKENPKTSPEGRPEHPAASSGSDGESVGQATESESPSDLSSGGSAQSQEEPRLPPGDPIGNPPHKNDRPGHETPSRDYGESSSNEHETPEELPEGELSDPPRSQIGHPTDIEHVPEKIPKNPFNDMEILPSDHAKSSGSGFPEGDEMDRETSGNLMMGDVTLLYLSAGLWYGRACVNSRRTLHMEKMNTGAEWCTIYVRTNGSTLDKPGQMFELRVEASLAMAFSLAGVLISATFCCCKRHNSLRMVFSVGSLFISGAVMAVPVVHTFLEHFTRHDKFVRDRNWDHLFISMHAQHDLFDHWSVILCGVASLISILSTFAFAVIACRSPMKPRNRYELRQSELGENPEKRNPQLNLMGNGKVTLPPGNAFTQDPEHTQELADDIDSEKVKPESSSPSARDSGESTSVDSFEVAKEMTSFRGEDILEMSDSGYSVVDDADETSETSIQ